MNPENPNTLFNIIKSGIYSNPCLEIDNINATTTLPID